MQKKNTSKPRNPKTPKLLDPHANQILTDEQKREVAISTRAHELDILVVESAKDKTFRYALKAVLFELGNQTGIGTDSPGVVGAFYRAITSQFLDSDDTDIQQCFRHLDVLLNNRDAKTARALANYWDAPSLNRTDPFPASTASRRGERKEGQS